MAQNKPLIYAVITAAGSSTRMGGTNKLWIEFAGKSILEYTIEAFDQSDYVDGIIVTYRKEEKEKFETLLHQNTFSKKIQLVEGGLSRTESVLNGVKQCPNDVPFVAIHDGARPLITQDLIERTCKVALEYGSAIPIVPIKDSIKLIEGNKIAKNIERSSVVCVQTPQIFPREHIQKALEYARINNIHYTDDCAAMEAMGQTVYTTQGSYENMKITTPEDILFMEAILKHREK